MIRILGGSKTGYNLYRCLERNGINSTFYFFEGEFGEKRRGGVAVSSYIPDIGNDKIIVSSERAFVYYKEYLYDVMKTHYYLRDKSNFSVISEQLDVKTISEQNVDRVEFPVFIKPKQSGEGKVPFKTKLARNSEELSKVNKYLDDCVLQKYLSPKQFKQIDIGGYFTGTEASLISLVEKNQYPIGVASYVSHNDSINVKLLKIKLAKFLNSLNFKGFIEVEFKYDMDKNDFFLMDVNPRPWGCFYYYISAVENIKDVILSGEEPNIKLKKSWINLPRLVFSNLNGRFVNPPLTTIIGRQICYEPLF